MSAELETCQKVVSVVDVDRLQKRPHPLILIACRVLDHAFTRAHAQHHAPHLFDRHAGANLAVQRASQLGVVDDTIRLAGQGKRHRQHDVARCWEVTICGLSRGDVHAFFQRRHAVAEAHFGGGQMFGGCGFAVPHFHFFHACGYFLAIRANVLHDGCAHSSWNSRERFDAAQAMRNCESDESIPAHSRIGADSGGRGGVRIGVRFASVTTVTAQNMNGVSSVAHNDPGEVLITDEKVRTAANNEQGKLFVVGEADGVNKLVARVSLNEMGNRTTHTNRGDISETRRNAHLDLLRLFSNYSQAYRHSCGHMHW